MKLFAALLLIIGILPVSVLSEEWFIVSGVSGKEKDNIEIYLSNIASKNDTSNRQIESKVQEALRALGYFKPQIHIQNRDNKKTLIKIIAGQRVKIASSQIMINGSAGSDKAFIKLVKRSQLHVGDPLNQGHYESFKSGLSDLALKRGYFDAKLMTSELLINPDTSTAYITIKFDSGTRYHFGETTFKGSQINVKKLYTMVPYEEGDNYLASSIGLLNQRLANMNWFSSVFAGADIDNRSDDTVPIIVALTPDKKNKMETGIGYTTNHGPRLKWKWQKPWINSAGHSLNFQTELSQYQPTAQVAYKIPLYNVLDDFYQFIGGVRYVDIHDTMSTDVNFSVERHWQLASWNQILSMRWLYEKYQQGHFEEGIANMGIIGLAYSRSIFSKGIIPKHANKSYIYLGYSNPWLGSTSTLFDFRTRQGWIETLAKHHRAILRLEGGAVTADSLEDIPPALRFFIGGDNSIRGYRYQSIAPVDSENKLRGGQYMATASIEYQYNVWGNWWAATFFDYGSSWYKTPHFVRGTGVGVRWASPIGSIRLDIGWGLDNADSPYEIHFTLGPEI